MTYKLIKDPVNDSNTLVKVNEDGREMFLPFDPDNTDYQAYLKWLEEGGVPIPADEVTA